MGKVRNWVTVLDVVREIHRQASELVTLKAFSTEDEWRRGALSGTVTVLTGLAEKAKDLELYAVLDDLEYACNHINLANFKAESVLREAEPKIRILEEQRGGGVY